MFIRGFKRNNIEWYTVKNIKSENMFSKTDWAKIFADLSSCLEIDKFISLGYGQCFIARNLITNEDFAFVFVYLEDYKTNKIVFHGGGWKNGNTMLHYTALVYLLEKLFKRGYKIRTSCLRSNQKAFRFIHSVGFINHYTSENHHYFWLPYKRFINTNIYKRINSKCDER